MTDTVSLLREYYLRSHDALKVSADPQKYGPEAAELLREQHEISKDTWREMLLVGENISREVFAKLDALPFTMVTPRTMVLLARLGRDQNAERMRELILEYKFALWGSGMSSAELGEVVSFYLDGAFFTDSYNEHRQLVWKLDEDEVRRVLRDGYVMKANTWYMELRAEERLARRQTPNKLSADATCKRLLNAANKFLDQLNSVPEPPKEN